MTDIDAILRERHATHGDFSTHARITQNIKTVMQSEQGNAQLTCCQREALDMIAHKIGRILAGNPNHKDHWDDIAGYAMLVSDRCGDA